MIDETRTIDTEQLIIPALAGPYRALGPLAYAAIRVLTALMLFPGGIDKLFYGGAARIGGGAITAMGWPVPYAWAWAVTCIESLGSHHARGWIVHTSRCVRDDGATSGNRI